MEDAFPYMNLIWKELCATYILGIEIMSKMIAL